MSIVGATYKEKYIYLGMGLVLLGSLITSGYFAYSWYKGSQEQAAYKDLAESLNAYGRIASAVDPSKKETAYQWDEVERALQVGAELHSSSSLYPYFLSAQADLLVRRGKREEGILMMDKALSVMNQSHPLYFLYALKDGLMNIDSSDALRVTKGQELVEKLANDVANPLQDMALYYSAVTARLRGDTELAQKRVQQLTARGDESSLWYQKALNSKR